MKQNITFWRNSTSVFPLLRSALRSTAAFRSATAAIFAVAAAWLVYNGASLPIWYDETISLLEFAGNPSPKWDKGVLMAGAHQQAFAGSSSFSGILEALYENDVHPPLYYLIALAWTKLFGGDLFGLRVLSALFVLGAALLVARSAAPLGKTTQLLTLLLFLGAPAALWAGVNARGYGLAMLLIAAAILTCTRELAKDAEQVGGRDTLQLVSLTGLFAGLAFLTHYLTLLVLGPLFAVLALLRLRRAPLAVLSGSTLYALCGLAVSPMLLKQLGARPDAFTGFESFTTELTALIVILFAAVSEPAQQLWISLPQFLLFLALLAGAAIYTLRGSRQDKSAAIHIVGLAGFCCGLLLLFLISDKSLAKAGGLDRYSTLALPFLALLIGRVPAQLRQRSRTFSGIATAAIAAFIAITWWDGELRKAQWTNEIVFSTVEERLPEIGAQRALAVVPSGYGRGMPGTWAHELPADMPMLVLQDPDELKALEGRIADYDLFALGDDLSERSFEDIAAFARTLKERGFVTEEGIVFVRAGDGG